MTSRQENIWLQSKKDRKLQLWKSVGTVVFVRAPLIINYASNKYHKDIQASLYLSSLRYYFREAMARFIILIVLLTFSATSVNAAVLLGCCESMKAAAEEVKPCHEVSHQKSPSKSFSKSGFCPYLCVSQLAEGVPAFSHVITIASIDAPTLSHDMMKSLAISPPYPPPKK